MHIRQIQVAHHVIDDRLLMRIATHAKEEIRIHLTRHFLKSLWPHLSEILLGHLVAAPIPSTNAQQSAEPATQSNASSAEAHTAAPSPGPAFDQPFSNDNEHFPLGEAPMLATEAKLTVKDCQHAELILSDTQQRALTLNLDSDLLQGLCAMLRAASQKAEWGLNLEYQRLAAAAQLTPAGEPNGGPEQGGSRLLH